MFSRNELDRLNKALDTYPANVDNRLRRAKLYMSEKDYNNAFTDYKYVYDKYPANSEALEGMRKCETYLSSDKASNTIPSNTIPPFNEEIVRNIVERFVQKNKTAEKKPQTYFFKNLNQPSKENLENQQEKQDKLISAISNGEGFRVPDLIQSGAKLTQPDKNGVFPLAAAVYRLKPKLIKEIEASLGEVALEQWKKVDINIFYKNLSEQFPEALDPNPYLEYLGRWFDKYRAAIWCDIYDKQCNSSFHSWLHYKSWHNRKDDLEYRADLVSLEGDHGLHSIRVVPEKIMKQHNNAVLEVKKYLDSFREEVESKVLRTENTLEL